MTVDFRVAGMGDLPGAATLMRQVVNDDLGGWNPRWHGDIGDLAVAYLRPPDRVLVVAEVDGGTAGVAAVRPCQLQAPPNPSWLVGRYRQPGVAELVRVWVGAEFRRQGLARGLVRRAVDWAVHEGGYRTIYLHTDASVPGAESFWRSMPTVEVYDARPDPHNCIHFELDAEKLLGDDR